MKHEKLYERNGLFDTSVPRYTSYPPANRFAPVLDASIEEKWLSDLSPDKPVSAYVHIPYCQRLCWFCACRTQGTKSTKTLERYIENVIAEMKLKSSKVSGKLKISRLHLGGGTPTILPVELTAHLLDAVFSSLDGNRIEEFSVEIDPTDVDKARIDILRDFGLSRASLGVQDFDPQVQDAIGRHQSFETTQKYTEYLRHVGVENINLDILYGLPFQTSLTLAETLDQVLTLSPDRIAAFGYAHVPWMSRRQKLINAEDLPNPRMRLELFQNIQKRLVDAGYVQIGIDHFARPHDALYLAKQRGNLHRNFQGYTDDCCETLLGFGASAISKYKDGFRQNAPFIRSYFECIAASKLPAARGYCLTNRDKSIGYLVEQLMCYGSVRLSDMPNFGEIEFKRAKKRLAALSNQFKSVVHFDQDLFVIKPEFSALTRIIVASAEGLKGQQNQHSIAI